MSPTALVVGATGAVAHRLVERLRADDWNIVGLCRRPPAGTAPPRVAFVQADLLDAADCRRALAGPAADATHVFYTARAKHGESGIESIPENVAMLANVLDAVLPVARRLAHVHLVTGGKWYGLHLGPYPTPAREDDPRPAVPNFYHAQQDLLEARQRGAAWTWSSSRPNILCDFVPGRARNLPTVLGAYAAVLRELGEPLHFPGSDVRWHALMEATDATLLADAIAFIATRPAAANRAFNVSNGDLFRWARLWPRIAAHYGMSVGDVRPVRLDAFMRDKTAVWQRVVARHALAPSSLDDIGAWAFGDFVFGMDWDVASSTTHLREAGFHAVEDTEAMFVRQLAQYREARILP